MKSRLVAVLLLALPLAAQVPFSTFLKANATVKQIATDSSGFIYVYGEVTPKVFVGRVSPQTGEFTWLREFGDSPTVAAAMAVDAAGNAYITGYTSENPVLPFVTKIDVTGATVYSSQFSGGIRAIPQSIAVDNAGQVVVSGSSSEVGFPVTTGAYSNSWAADLPFVTKLDATGTKLVFSGVGVGGSSLVLDKSGNVFMAGIVGLFPASGPGYPTTAGAFQTTYQPYTYCVSPSCGFPGHAGEQYVTKLSADGSKLIYSTFITGSKGAYNAGLAVDSAGNAWVTGGTKSDDYPYTTAPPASKSRTFTSKLDPTGSTLLLSVPVGVPPGIGNNLTIDAQGNLIATGSFPPSTDGFYTSPIASLDPPVPSPAPPVADYRPSQCVGTSPGGVYAIRISSADGSVIGSKIIPGVTLGTAVISTADSQGNLYVAGTIRFPTIPLTQGVAWNNGVTARTNPGVYLARVNFSAPAEPIGCVTDAVSTTLLGPAAPGQLITLYGTDMGTTVTFDGQAAPVLYASPTQVNVQVPFEVAGKASTLMQMSSQGTVLQSRLFAVVPENPSAFVRLVADNLPCGNTRATGFVAFALNQDGSINSCDNPAPRGSQISLFVNGIGTSTTNRNTGVPVTRPSFINGFATATSGYSLEIASFMDQAGAISGVGQLVLRVPDRTALPGQQEPSIIGIRLNLNGYVAGPLNAATATSSFAETPVLIFATP